MKGIWGSRCSSSEPSVRGVPSGAAGSGLRAGGQAHGVAGAGRDAWARWAQGRLLCRHARQQHAPGAR